MLGQVSWVRLSLVRHWVGFGQLGLDKNGLGQVRHQLGQARFGKTLDWVRLGQGRLCLVRLGISWVRLGISLVRFGQILDWVRLGQGMIILVKFGVRLGQPWFDTTLDWVRLGQVQLGLVRQVFGLGWVMEGYLGSFVVVFGSFVSLDQTLNG